MLKGPIEVAIPSMRMPLSTLDQIRLERFTVALEGTHLHLTIRSTTLISKEDRFALLEPIIETRNVANLFQDYQKRGTIAEGVVTGVATEFFAALHEKVEWLGD